MITLLMHLPVASKRIDTNARRRLNDAKTRSSSLKSFHEAFSTLLTWPSESSSLSTIGENLDDRRKAALIMTLIRHGSSPVDDQGLDDEYRKWKAVMDALSFDVATAGNTLLHFILAEFNSYHRGAFSSYGGSSPYLTRLARVVTLLLTTYSGAAFKELFFKLVFVTTS